MSDRLATMRRIAKVQAQMKRMAEWKLAATEQKLAATEADRLALNAFVDTGAGLGDLAQLAMRQTARLALREKAMAAKREQASAAAFEARRRSKTADLATDAMAREERDATERRDLERLIEASVTAQTS